MTVEIQVPVLGESVSEATVGKWYKAVGDAVAVDEVVCELETDKVALEVTASAAGALSEIVAKEGDNVEVGALLGKIDETAQGKAAEKPVAKDTPAKEEKPKDNRRRKRGNKRGIKAIASNNKNFNRARVLAS